MFCTNCGAKIPDGSAFCSMCGSKQPVLTQPAPEPQKVESMPESVVQPVEESTYVQPNYGQEPNYGQISYYQNQELGRRKKSPLVPILIIAMVLLLIGAGVLTYFLFFRGSNEVLGKYKVVALNVLGYNIDPSISDPDGNLSSSVEINLMDNDRGTMSYDGKTTDIIWTLENNIFTFRDTNGQPLKDFFDSNGGTLEYRNGRIWCVVKDSSGSSSDMGAVILAKDGDDLSDLNIQSGLDVFQKIFGGGLNRGGATAPETTEEPLPTATPAPAEEPIDWSDPAESPEPTANVDPDDVNPELKKAVDKFADSVDEFISAFQDYKDNPTDNVDKYLDAMEKYSKLADKVTKIEGELIDKGKFTEADQAYVNNIFVPLLNKLTDEMESLAQ